MNPSRSFSSIFIAIATLLGGCHPCIGVSTKWRSRDVGANDGDARDSAGPENAVSGAFCLLAIVFTVITIAAAEDASDTNTKDAATADAVPAPAADPVGPRNVELRNAQTKPDAITDDAESDDEQDLLLSAIHHLTTFRGNDCSDILLCAEEPIWDDSMDDVLCDILSCATDSMRASTLSQAADGSDEEMSIPNEEEAAEEVVVSEDKYRDLMSLYTLRDPACMGVPAMSPIDSVVSISSDSFCSYSSLGSGSLMSRTRTRKMSPQPNAEWAIIE